MIEDSLEEIGQLCRLHDVRKLEVFGSILRQDFDPQRSDVDVLVEFQPRLASGFFAGFLGIGPSGGRKAMSKLALYVSLKAKSGKEQAVADFLRSALPLVNDEPGTRTWYAIQEGPFSFAIFDTFDDEAGRKAFAKQTRHIG